MPKKDEGPDQPRSWAIAMAGCVINSLLSGLSRTTGLFYVALIETYGVSRMEANMPFTLRNVVRNLFGPVAGAIGQRYGARDVTFVGGVFGFLGIALCSLAPNVIWITVLWGGVHGMGVALGNTLFPIIINQYFLKYRATASGLSLSGACIGSFVFPVALEYMLRHLGLSGTLLITGGCLMHVMPAAILMTEPPWVKRKPIEKQADENCKRDNKMKSVSLRVQNLGQIGEDTEVVSVVDMKRIPSSGVICEEAKDEEDRFQPTTRSARVFSRNGVDNLAFVGSKVDLSESSAAEQVKEEFQEEIRVRTVSIGDTSISFSERLVAETQETSVKRGIVKLIQNPMFYVISASLAGFALLFDPAITVIVDYISDKGLVDDDAKYFIIMMSAGDLLGRLCFGWVTDRNYISVPRFMLLLQVVQGVCFLLLPLFYGFGVLMTIITIYGIMSGATLVMFPILVAKYMSSVQSLAIGFVSIFSGILSLAVPLLIGYFRDNAGSYNGMFLITGSLSVAAGCLWLFEPLLLRLQKRSHGESIVISS